MAEEIKTEKKLEPTFEQRLQEQGWSGYYLADVLEDLKNPNKEHIAMGATDAIGKKQIVIVVPREEIIRFLAKITKASA